jgi:WD40 repeat protein
LRGHQGRVEELAFSPDGQHLAAASTYEDKDRRFIVAWKVWNLGTGKVLWEDARVHVRTVSEALGFEHAMDFSPDAQQIATANGVHEVLIWDIPSGKQLHRLNAIPEVIHRIAWSPDGQRLAAAGGGQLRLSEHVIQVWDLATLEARFLWQAHKGAIHSLAFNHDAKESGRFLATGSADKTVKIWDLRPPDAGPRDPANPARNSPRLLHTLRGHNQSVRAIAFSPDAKRLASVSSDRDQILGETKLWDFRTGQEVLSLDHAGTDVAFSPDGLRLAVAGANQTIKLWDGTPRRELLTCHDAGSYVTYSAKSVLLATCGHGDTIKLWHAETGQEFRTLMGSVEGYQEGHAKTVRCVAYSPDGLLLASGGEDKSIKIWDATGSTVMYTLVGHTDTVLHLAFSPQGNRLASASADESVRMWNLATGKELYQFTGHNDRVLCVIFSPDGKYLASGGDDKTVRIWDAETGREVLKLEQHDNAVNGVAFNPDGNLLASASEDKTIKVWDVATGKVVRTLAGHTDGVRAVAFSPGGRQLASASWDKSIKIWDVSTGRELLTLYGHTAGVTSLCFGPNGWLISASPESPDMRLRIWNAKP